MKLFGMDRDRDNLIFYVLGVKIAFKTKLSKYIYNLEQNRMLTRVEEKDSIPYLLRNTSIEISNIKKYTIHKNKHENIKNIAIINTVAKTGGAAKIAYTVANEMGKRGFNSTMFTGIYEQLEDEQFVKFSQIGNEKEYNSNYQLSMTTGLIDFYFHSSFDIKNKIEFRKSDIVHLNNLHGGYFSLLALPELTALKPTIWTLHDDNSFTGHCGFSLKCSKWKNESCKSCTCLDLYQAIPFDSADHIYETKKHIYKNISDDIVLVAPSQWLVDRVKKSILKDKEIRCIPNGINEKIFKPYDKKEVRDELNLPQDKKILMFACDGGTTSPWKGGEYILETYNRLSSDKDLFFISIGSGDKISIENGNYLKVPYIKDESLLAKYYSASDLFIYPSKADSFGIVVAEALSCCLPVITFNTGGIPEIVEHMKTGYVANYCDTDDFIKGIKIFLDDKNLRESASNRGRQVVEQKFTNDIMIASYMNLYNEVFERRK